MTTLAGKNVLVTGATGLVGSHLVEALLAEGAQVVATYRSQNPRSYFAEHHFESRVILAACDLKNYERVFDVVTRYGIDYIFHVAAQPIVETAYYNPRETLEDNVLATVNILESARLYPKVKGVIVASSDKAYGKDCIDATEDAPMAGDHPYDVSKSCADLIARMYATTYQMPVAVSRFGNIYGPGDLNLNRIVPGIMQAVYTGSVLPLRSDGTFVRDYVYVKDVVSGYVTLMKQIDQVRGEAFNFSTGYNYSVREMIELIGKILGTPVQYTVVNDQKNEIPKQSLNFAKAEKVLGWSSAFTFEEGIRETAEWYKRYFQV